MISVFFLLGGLSDCSISVISPKKLADKFSQGLAYSIANFGHIPYGLTSFVKVVHAEDNLFCEKPKNKSSHAQGQIVYLLILRGNCTFVTKARNAQQAGYNGIIVVNNDQTHSESLIMVSDGYGFKVNIPCLMVDKKDGEILQSFKDVYLKVFFQTQKQDKASVFFIIDSSKRDSYYILSQFAPFFQKLGQQVVVTLIFRTVDKEMCLNCRNIDCIGSHCIKTILNLKQLEGQYAIKEALLQYYFVKQNPHMFFEYIKLMKEHCTGRDNRYQCAVQYLKNFSDSKHITELVEQQCKLIQKGKQSVVDYWQQTIYDSGSVIFPSVVVNNLTYRGQEEGFDLFQLVCNSINNPPSQCSQVLMDSDSQAGSLFWFVLKRVLLSVLVVSGVMLVAMLGYKKYKQRELKKKMPQQINTIVSQYMAYYDDKN